MTSGDTWNTLC